jgi:hypothetical protein
MPETHEGADQSHLSFETSETSAGRSDAGEAHSGSFSAEETATVSAELSIPEHVIPAPYPGSGEQPIIAQPVATVETDAPAPRRRRANGVKQATTALCEAPEPKAKTEAQAEAEAEAEIKPQSVETNGEENTVSAAETASEMKHKPRGSKRGWWQRRAAE